ncbi:MAG: M23 family metallopeptidase, partial [Mycobacteriaceae bacterium]|nr:M23 family metallopeptidase [Mycobacteriaceae bacterium]
MAVGAAAAAAYTMVTAHQPVVTRTVLAAEKALHDGIDLAGPVGTPIYAAADGVVKEAGPTNSGYGAWVLLQHSDGTVTRYGHINSWSVQVGQRVFAGDEIASIGNRGNS